MADIQYMYGIGDDNLVSCLMCGNTKLTINMLQITLGGKNEIRMANIPNSSNTLKNGYCDKCKAVWVKGLHINKFKKNK